MRGNVLDLAVGVIIGAAFQAIVTSLTSDIISPILGIFGGVNFDQFQVTINGALLVVDEIEDSLHPLLTRRLIEMVQDKAVNTKGAQLIFTTHDAMLLDLNFFRRDQIWFAEKNDETCATELYSLASFSPRKGENVRKGYLQGRFGAIPFIGGDA